MEGQSELFRREWEIVDITFVQKRNEYIGLSDLNLITMFNLFLYKLSQSFPIKRLFSNDAIGLNV